MENLSKNEFKLKNLFNTRAQEGGYISFFIMCMLAVIIALQVTLPVIDSALNYDNATANMSSAAQTLLTMIPLFTVLALLMIFIRPLL